MIFLQDEVIEAQNLEVIGRLKSGAKQLKAEGLGVVLVHVSNDGENWILGYHAPVMGIWTIDLEACHPFVKFEGEGNFSKFKIFQL